MEKLKAILLVIPYHILIPYLYAGTDFFLFNQMFAVPAIGITYYLAHTTAMSGNAYSVEILKTSSHPVTFYT